MTEVASSLAEILSGNAGDSVEMTPELLTVLKQAMAQQIAEASSDSEKPKKSGRRKTRKKDPNAPKRSQSAYMLWLNNTRSKIISEHFTGEDGECTLEGRSKVTEVAKKAGELWKTISSEEKEPFEVQAETDKAAYQVAKAEYSSIHSDPQVVDEAELPEAPEGWSGPLQNTYLWKMAEKPRKYYSTFAEAVERAEEIGSDECGGITRDEKGRYSLRKPGSPWPIDSASVSWCMGEVTIVTPKPKTAKSNAKLTIVEPVSGGSQSDGETPLVDATHVVVAAKPKTVAKAKTVEATHVAITSKSKTVAETAKTPVAEIAKTPVAEIAKTPVEAPVETPVAEITKTPVEAPVETPGAVTEPDDANHGVYEDEPDGDDDLHVDQIEVDGVDYLFNPDTSDVYDFEVYSTTEEIVTIGRYNPDTEELSLN